MNQINVNNCLNSELWLEKSSQESYGCHTPLFNNNLREKKCMFCAQRKTSTLEELAFSVILENAELLEKVDSVLCHLPHRICWLIGRALNANLLAQAWKLVDFVSKYGETRTTWFDVDQSKIIYLTRFRLYCHVSQQMKPYLASRSAGIDEILQYLGNFDSTYSDLWSQMTSAVTKLKTETDGEDLMPLKSTNSADDNNVVLIKATELAVDSLLDRYEYQSMKQLQRLNKTFACPVVFKPTTIEVGDLESEEISHLLDFIDPEVIVSVDIKMAAWTVADVNELERVLSACNHLSSIYLRQKSSVDEVEGVVPAVLRLLSQQQQLQKVGLAGFHVSGTFARYPLPPVENLRLRVCTFTEEDWSFMAHRPDLALKSLVVTSYHYDVHFPSLSVFIENQAKSLETLELDFPTVSPTEICELLRTMAKFNKLQEFNLNCEEELDLVSTAKIIGDLMSIRSSRKFIIDVPTNFDFSQIMAIENLFDNFMKELCRIFRRPPIKLFLNM